MELTLAASAEGPDLRGGGFRESGRPNCSKCSAWSHKEARAFRRDRRPGSQPCAREFKRAKVYCSTLIKVDFDASYENLLYLFALSSRSAVASGVRSRNRAHV